MTLAPSLPRGTPEAQGIASGAISAFVSAAERDLDALHSFMLLRHGHVVADGWWEPYRPHDQHVLFSLSKSFTSTAIDGGYTGPLSQTESAGFELMPAMP